jgi:hypothetical protein
MDFAPRAKLAHCPNGNGKIDDGDNEEGAKGNGKIDDGDNGVGSTQAWEILPDVEAPRSMYPCDFCQEDSDNVYVRGNQSICGKCNSSRTQLYKEGEMPDMRWTSTTDKAAFWKASPLSFTLPNPHNLPSTVSEPSGTRPIFFAAKFYAE